MRKFKILIILLIFFTLYAIRYTLYATFAQHAGHQMPGAKEEVKSKETAPKKIYRCPMHPQVVSDKPGKCPICGMNLAEVTQEKLEQTKEAPAQESTVKIKEEQQQLIGVKTEPVKARPLMRMVRTVAKIAYDPELYKAEQEFIQAYKTKERIKSGKSAEINDRLDALLLASTFKLKLLGLSDEQIEELKHKTESDRALLISDEKTPYVWAYGVIYEYDISSIKIGDHITLKTIAYPNEEFSGTVKAIDPVLDPDTRSVRLRALIDNPQAKLKPNMYGDIFIHLDLGTQLAVPAEAILDTGLRKVIYLDLGKGQFKVQEVEVGPEAIALVDSQESKFFPVIKGLKENDMVVTRGNFLIDSQSQLSGGMSALWGGATEIKQEGETEIKTQHKH